MKAAEQLLDETTRRGPAGMGEPIDMAALLGREKFEDFLRQLEAQLSDFLARLCDQPPDVARLVRGGGDNQSLPAAFGCFHRY